MGCVLPFAFTGDDSRIILVFDDVLDPRHINVKTFRALKFRNGNTLPSGDVHTKSSFVRTSTPRTNYDEPLGYHLGDGTGAGAGAGAANKEMIAGINCTSNETSPDQLNAAFGLAGSSA
jgi:hypothetical protein